MFLELGAKRIVNGALRGLEDKSMGLGFVELSRVIPENFVKLFVV